MTCQLRRVGWSLVLNDTTWPSWMTPKTRAVEQLPQRTAQRTGAGQQVLNGGEMPHVRPQVLDSIDLRRGPAPGLRAFAEHPYDRRLIRPLLGAHGVLSASRLRPAIRGLRTRLLHVPVQIAGGHQLTVAQALEAGHALIAGEVVAEVPALQVLITPPTEAEVRERTASREHAATARATRALPSNPACPFDQTSGGRPLTGVEHGLVKGQSR